MKFKLNGYQACLDETPDGWRVTLWDRFDSLLAISAPVAWPDSYILARRMLNRAVIGGASR